MAEKKPSSFSSPAGGGNQVLQGSWLTHLGPRQKSCKAPTRSTRCKQDPQPPQKQTRAEQEVACSSSLAPACCHSLLHSTQAPVSLLPLPSTSAGKLLHKNNFKQSSEAGLFLSMGEPWSQSSGLGLGGAGEREDFTQEQARLRSLSLIP